MAKKFRSGGFSSKVNIEVEETSAPMFFWPDGFRGEFKALVQAEAASEHSAMAWYRWRYNNACWQSILFLPEESVAIVELGKGSTALVDDVRSPEDALKLLLAGKAMPNPTCGCPKRNPAWRY